jgi:hypothetical protein
MTRLKKSLKPDQVDSDNPNRKGHGLMGWKAKMVQWLGSHGETPGGLLE